MSVTTIDGAERQPLQIEIEFTEEDRRRLAAALGRDDDVDAIAELVARAPPNCSQSRQVVPSLLPSRNSAPSGSCICCRRG
jgi:hypothetical protein